MIVAWAPGGGLGHLTRIAAFRHTVGADTADVTIVSGSAALADRRIVGDAAVVLLRPELARDVAALRRELARILGDTAASELWVDAFPAGIRGELARTAPAGVAAREWCEIGGIRRVHLARRLRLGTYAGAAAPPAAWDRFARVHVTERIAAAHRDLLAATTPHLVETDLVEATPASEPDASVVAQARDAWLVVHSGPADEVAELRAYALDVAAAEGDECPRVVVIGPGGLDVYPAWPLFAHARRIVTAAGANAVRQTEAWAARRLLLPFPRRFDDQFARARAARQSSSNRMSRR